VTTQRKQITKRELAALGQVFAAEIKGRLHQSKAIIFNSLAFNGLVEMTEIDDRGAFGGGWALTDAGRIAYFEWASTQPTEEEDQRQ
jgi:hypothetical protein